MPAPRYTGEVNWNQIPDWALQDSIPNWLRQNNQGAAPDRLASLFRTFGSRNPNAAAVGGAMDRYRTFLGTHPNAPFFAQHPPQQGGTPPPPAQAPPAAPTTPALAPRPQQQAGPSPYFPAGTGQAGGTPAPYAFNDPFQSFLSAVPLMNMNASRQIGDAMSQAGFTGNRWGSSAIERAGQIGAENSLAQNNLLLQTLGDYANRTEDRALTATGMSTDLGGLLDQMTQARIQLPFQVGQYEQGRQDGFSNTAFQDWSQNRLGWFPYLLQAAMSRNAGSPGQVYQNQIPGTPSGLDQWGPILAGLLG